MSDPLQLVGTTVAEKYAIESLVGEGGFAVVYKATHLVWKRPVAIKAFKAMGSFSEHDRERLLGDFVREGALLAELSERSAAICQARDVGTLTTPGGSWTPFMVLEWLDGVSLERALQDEQRAAMPPRSPSQALHLLEPIAEAMALAHARGIAHRDVKPGNIFLLGDPRAEGCPVKLLDFGIAKVVQDAQKMAGGFSQTTGQVTSFTPSYGAPEQFSRAHGATGPWTDVFAMGLIFAQLVSGKEPLEGDDIAQLAFSAMDVNRRPTPRTLGVHVTDELEAVVARARAIPTQDRWATMGEFWNALRSALDLTPMRTITARPSEPRLAPALDSLPPPRNDAASATAMATASRTTGGGKPSRTGVTAGVVTALIVAVGAGTFLSRKHEPPAVAAPKLEAAPAPAPPKAPTCPDGMVLVSEGKFFMGSDDKTDLAFERPAHQVTLAPFCIDTFEVTTARYKACSDKGECKRASVVNEWEGIKDSERKTFDPLCNAREPEQRGNHPINCIDWEMASQFCHAAAPQGRLPTEAEWEFATRGRDGRRFPWGDEWPDAKHLNACDAECMAWGKKNHVEEHAMYESSDGFATTAPVGSFPAGASPFGLQDVVGNVWEWTSDWYAPYGSAPLTDPKGPDAEVEGQGRVIRGGAWNGAYPAWVRPTFRYHDAPDKRSYGIGFRCAANL